MVHPSKVCADLLRKNRQENQAVHADIVQAASGIASFGINDFRLLSTAIMNAISFRATASVARLRHQKSQTRLIHIYQLFYHRRVTSGRGKAYAHLPRYVIPGHPQHVIVRGNNRKPIFLADADYHFYLKKLRLACMKHRCDVHASVRARYGRAGKGDTNRQ